jgi:activator of HSP90 ATPase
MQKTIEQSVVFPASPAELYELYINPKKHAAFTGAGVKISAKAGSAFSAFDKMLSGTTLFTLPGKMIVQRWRGYHWNKTDLDSILVLSFSAERKGGRITIAHSNVPAHDHAGVTKGWKKYYWKPLRKFLKQQSRSSK